MPADQDVPNVIIGILVFALFVFGTMGPLNAFVPRDWWDPHE